MTPGDELLFLALGGSGEIGMNANLYGCRGKWVMVDLGVTFADPWQTPLPSAAFNRQHPADYVAKAADMESMRLGLDLARMPTLAE